MPSRSAAQPPRPIAPGDVVATYSDDLGEWTAAQIIHLDHSRQEADVLDLDWSGPEPADVAALGGLKPLRLSHHEWSALAQMGREWVLPRSHRVIGRAPLLVSGPCGRHAQGWRTGMQLAAQRRWDAGDREDLPDERYQHIDSALRYEPADGGPLPPYPQIRDLSVSVRDLDCAWLVETYPSLTSLRLWGSPGWLTNVGALNLLHALRTLAVFDMFGMTAADCLEPGRLPNMESIQLESIPADFAVTMRRTWTPEASNGVYLCVTKPRQPKWVEANMTNPLRDWDGREGISPSAYKGSLHAWAKTTSPITDALIEPMSAYDLHERLAALGRDFARAFDKVAGPSHLIETQERDELLEALHNLITTAPTGPDVDREQAALTVIHSINQERTW